VRKSLLSSHGSVSTSLDNSHRLAEASPSAQAPLQHGSQAVELYLSRLLSQPSLIAYTEKLGYSPIKSFRYLLQDSPKGFFLTDKFIDSLDCLGKKGYAFDLTLDTTHKDTGGPLILDDAIEAISKVRELQKEGDQTRFILGELNNSSRSLR